MKKIVFIHTVPDIISRLNRELKLRLPGTRIENIMDDQLSTILQYDREKVLDRLNTLVRLAEDGCESGDVEFILTCTALSDIADEAHRPLQVLDQYLHKALAELDSFLLVATSEGALSPTTKGIQKYSSGKDIRKREIYVNGAREAIKNGDKSLHDRLITTAIIGALEKESYDGIALCQPSMSHLKDELSKDTQIAVLTGIDTFLENFRIR
ncbi:hypothetical protein [Desulforhopalus sp. IMCC35007]|uniref:hypothetical protein n=1 Tax=Desulforhopalus sp. IMCC35007 TaxID=2569543 RepID=UPI0010ADA5CD|nr:hypothetical protein [Desulforhopalus sp. IMCC35007]TKB05903.1 hypothetical protein FCL48_22930 [Desulforhopalus sp. IMCC35007]